VCVCVCVDWVVTGWADGCMYVCVYVQMMSPPFLPSSLPLPHIHTHTFTHTHKGGRYTLEIYFATPDGGGLKARCSCPAAIGQLYEKSWCKHIHSAALDLIKGEHVSVCLCVGVCV
jgi:hypothetical protein